jgi:hypothetical protein
VDLATFPANGLLMAQKTVAIALGVLAAIVSLVASSSPVFAQIRVLHKFRSARGGATQTSLLHFLEGDSDSGADGFDEEIGEIIGTKHETVSYLSSEYNKKDYCRSRAQLCSPATNCAGENGPGIAASCVALFYPVTPLGPETISTGV